LIIKATSFGVVFFAMLRLFCQENTRLPVMEKTPISVYINNMPKTIVYGLLLLFISCSTTHKKEVHIVPPVKKTIPVKPGEQSPPPPPPPIRIHYLTFNFWADSAGEIYYYPYRVPLEKCCREDDADALPEFIQLQPKDMVHIPTESVEDFIKLNILNVYESARWAVIASLKDTVESHGITKILASFKNKSNAIKWVFRKATQEEKVVLEYKQLNKNYNPDLIAWDRTKIILPAKENKAR
jgi:hypothetical protein